ncbi:hypothetical protein JCM10296v2_002754 [Rhodotorula toruloides]
MDPSAQPVREQQYSVLLRQSRLAEPPLDGLPHLSPDELEKELALFAPPTDPRRQSLLLNSVTGTVSSLCARVDDKLSRSQLLNLEDSTWVRKMCSRLASRVKEMSEGNERLKETYARAIDARLRADVEDQIRGKSAHVRTVGGFIVQTLQELLDLLAQGKQVPHHFLWQDVVSLEYIDVCTIIFSLIAPAIRLTRRDQLDMIAWVSYCDDPSGKTWQRILKSRKPAIEVSDRRIALHRRIYLDHSPKPEFRVEARSQNPGLSAAYDRLLSNYPWPQ